MPESRGWRLRSVSNLQRLKRFRRRPNRPSSQCLEAAIAAPGYVKVESLVGGSISVKKFALLRSCAMFAVPLAAGTALPTAAAAQQITTSIQGQVANEAGQPLANAVVTVTDTRTGN